MVTAFSSPVLSVAVDAVRDLEGKDALGGLWNLFTKCKESLQDGRRLENISWRLWHRELAAAAHHHADSLDCVTSDRNAVSTAAPLSPISDYGRGSSQDFDQQRLRSPSPALSVQSAISGISSRPASVRSNSSSSIGRIIIDMLPENKIDTTPPSRRPSVSGQHEPVSFKVASSALPTPELETIIAPFPTVILPPPSSHLGTTAPTVFPRVVIVNPTPHPTPPATPAPGPMALAAPQPLPHSHLLPPPRLLSAPQPRPTVAAQLPESQLEAVKQVAPAPAPQSKPALSAPVPAPLKNSAGEAKAVDRRFFLEQSPDNQSASSQASSSPARSGPSGCAPSAVVARSPSIASARSPSSEAGSPRGADPSSVNSNQTQASAASRRSGQHRSHQPRHNMTRARFSQRMHPLVQRKAAGTEAQHKAGSKGMFDVGSLGSDISRATSSSQRRPSDSIGKASPSPAASSALAPLSNGSGKARAAPEIRPVEPRKPAAPARPPMLRAQTGPAHLGARVTPTPAPQPLARAALVTATKSALKQPSASKQSTVEPARRKVVVASSDDYETTEGSDSESEGSTSDWEDDEEEQPKNKADEARLRAAALEAQRQRELFDKLPKRSYSNLNRTQSGLLSQLLNPDPAVLPPNNQLRSSSSANLQRGIVPAPLLSTSQSMAAIPQLSNITAQAPQARVDNHYRPRGRPAEQELEDESTDEEGDDDALSTSLAQQKLAELTDPNRRRRRSDQDPPRRTSPERSTLTSVATAPIPLNHPWNLPAPAPPMTPRTTRRQMLSTELSESLRRNLLWERQVSKTNLLRGGLKPLTQTRPEPPQPEPETEEQRRERERKERNKAAIARHRSWADDYHYAGW